MRRKEADWVFPSMPSVVCILPANEVFLLLRFRDLILVSLVDARETKNIFVAKNINRISINLESTEKIKTGKNDNKTV